MALEQAFQLTPGDIDIAGQFVELDRLLDVGLHQRHDLEKLRLRGAQHVLERHPLLIQEKEKLYHSMLFKVRVCEGDSCSYKYIIQL